MTLHPRDTVYDTTLFEDNFPAGVEDHFWFQARNRILDTALVAAESQGLLPNKPRILEVGCGTGIVVSALRRRGHDVTGVELGVPTPVAGAAGSMTTGLRAQDLAPAVRDGIDGLMFLDVIEHVPNDVALLRDTLAAFPNCRCVVVTVPARREVWSSHDTYYGHYRRYSRTMLRATLESAGLAPHTLRYAFRSLYAAAAAIKLTGRDRKPVMHAPDRPALHQLLAAGLRLEDALLGSLPIPGLSLLAVASIKPSRG